MIFLDVSFHKIITEPFKKSLPIFFKWSYYIRNCTFNGVRSCIIRVIFSFPCFNQIKETSKINIKKNRNYNWNLAELCRNSIYTFNTYHKPVRSALKASKLSTVIFQNSTKKALMRSIAFSKPKLLVWEDIVIKTF